MIDTSNKRRSMIGAGLLFRVVRPIPDGTISSVDRRHWLGLYRFGVDPEVGGPPSPGTLPPIGSLVSVTVSGPSGGLVTDEPPIGHVQ